MSTNISHGGKPPARVRKRTRGFIFKDRSGIYYAGIHIDGRKIVRSTRTRNRGSAEAMLDGMTKTLLRENGLLEDDYPLMAFWPCYENSPEAARMEAATLKGRRAAWRDFSRWMKENHPSVAAVDEVTRMMAELYVKALTAKGMASSTINAKIGRLREITGIAMEELGLRAANPWKRVKPVAGEKRTRRALTFDEMKRLVAAARRTGGEWLTLFLIGIYTGMRLGDCCCLKWSAVDFAGGSIRVIPQKTRKHSSGVPVTIPLHEELLSRLESIARGGCGEFVIPRLEDMYRRHHSLLNKRMKEIFEDAGITMRVAVEGRSKAAVDASFHSLRHTFVSLAANAGVPLAVVQAIVGHASSTMTQHYFHANDASLRLAVDALPTLSGMAAAGRRRLRSTPVSDNLVLRLRRLVDLHGAGLITGEEFAAIRGRILALV